MKNQYLVLLTLFFISFSLVSQEKKKKSEIKHVVYLIGDAGRPIIEASPSFDLLTKLINEDKNESTVIFLGDNIYPGGMPEKEDKGRKEAEEIIDFQLKILKELAVDFYFIPGNHDWNKGKKNGISHIRNEEKYIENYFDDKNVFVPNRGCPGPVKIKLEKNIILYAIDTQWWLHQYEKPPIEEADCGVSNKAEFLDELKEELHNNKDKHLIVVGHNPIYSDGNHGGYFQFKDHLFPLTTAKKNLYIPLPIVGSIYPLYRNIIGHSTDIIHPEYQSLISGLNDAFEGVDDLIYASGHEHNLQYYNKANQHYIVSGSAGETTYSSGKNGADFSDSKRGLFKLIYYKNGKVKMEVWENDEDEGIKMSFEKQIIEEKEEDSYLIEAELHKDEVFPETIVKAAGPQFAVSKTKEFFWGAHYRAAWLTPVEFPVLNLNTEKGGLKPVKMGGRLQSKSLRVESEDGNQYVLRSLTKFPERALPENMQNTIAASIFKDQISSSHPYAAYVIPPLADAAKILHTNPVAVYIPDSPNLLQYRDDFADQLVLYEQRAANDLSSMENFGYTKDAVKSDDLIHDLINDHDVVVDEKEVLRNRLFDMFIGDWDRHQDQWRWAEFTCKKENHEGCDHAEGIDKYYVPIPKDRDQAFAIFDGFYPTIITQKWLMPRFQSFEMDIKNIEGVNFNARYVDRFFLTRMDRNDWVEMGHELKELLTDEIIENAIKLWPDTIYNLDGETIIAKLKSHRDQLPEFADRYYDIIVKDVNILGTEKSEIFEVKRLDNDSTLVRVYKVSKSGEQLLFYERLFDNKETKEIRLYGLGGQDKFNISGDVKNGMLVRVIGGYGKDEISDSSSVNGLRKKTQIYDTEKKTVISESKETRIHTSKEKSSNKYDMNEYKPNVVFPNAFIGFNKDDGVFIGGGVTFKKHGFRKDPYKSKHRILANIASNFSFNALYTGTFIDLFGKIDFRADVLINNPKLTNFFGYGNETEFSFSDDDREKYIMRFNAISLRGLLEFSGNKPGVFRIGPNYQNYMTVEAPDRFLNDDAGSSKVTKTSSQYVGLSLDYKYEIKNKKVLPNRGMVFNVGASYNQELSGKNISNLRLKGKLTFYIPIYHALTYVINASGTTLLNDFEYYHSASLGGLNYTKDNDILRGYRRDRFNGRTSFAFNNELRFKLFNFQTFLFPGELGINAFYDVGKVWVDDESSRAWHSNFGGGIWMSPMDLMVINAYYSISNEENMFRLIVGFLF